MGRLLDNYLEKHNRTDVTALALIGTGCLVMLIDDDLPVSVKARLEELEQDAKRTVQNAHSIMLSPLRGGYTIDSHSKDD